jgi:hypothetical protein
VNRRRFKQYGLKPTALMLIPIIALTLAGIAYSHWQERLQIIAVVKTGFRRLTIGSEKLLAPTGEGFNENHPIEYYITGDKQALVAYCGNVTSGWKIAVGLVLENDGTLPIYLEEVRVEFNPPIKFSVEKYYYGPFQPGEKFNQYWSGLKIEEIPPSGYSEPHMLLESNDRAVTWTVIEYAGTEPISVEITVTPVYGRWP